MGIISVFAMHLHKSSKSKSKSSKVDDNQINFNPLTPILDRTESGRAGKLEKFSHYVGQYFLFSINLILTLAFFSILCS